MADKQQLAPLPPAGFTNQMRITNTKREFYFDFIQVVSSAEPDSFRPGHLIARVVTSPSHAKEMLKALKSSIGRYETLYGTLDDQKVAEDQQEH